MRSRQCAGLFVPLLTICAVLAGCGTSITQQPANFNSNPQVVAIYAVDSTTGVGPTLPDVLLFSTNQDDINNKKISTESPPSYGTYRVEFDQPLKASSVANNTDRADAVGDAASFCSPVEGAPIQLMDVQGDATRPGGAIVSSVCYDSSSPLGSNPHVLLVPGAGTTTSATAAPLTCNTFNSETGPKSLGGNIFKPNHTYGIKMNFAAVKNGADKPLAAPTGSGWQGDTFQFTTSGMKILAAGYQDAVTAFFHWVEKPERGFEKDRAPDAPFLQPSDNTAFLIILSEPTDDVSGITLKREDGSDPDSVVTTGGDAFGDPRIVEITTGDTFEGDQKYTVTVPGGGVVKANSGDPLTTGAIYNIKATPGAPRLLTSAPTNNATATATTTTVTLEFSAPVKADAAGTPVGTFTILDAKGTAVPLKSVKVVGKTNSQKVTITPGVVLAPETRYSVNATGVIVGASSNANQPFPPVGPLTFTTSTFRMARISNAGGTTNIDRTTTVNPVTLVANGVDAVFNSSAAGVDVNSLRLSELGAGNTRTTINNFTLTPSGTSGTTFTLKFPATYHPKFAQRYEIRAEGVGNKETPPVPPITDAAATSAGAPLKVENCQAGADCSDVKSFTTRSVGATIAENDDASGNPNGFVVTFTDPIRASSVTKSFPTGQANVANAQFNIFPRDPTTGALSDKSLPLTCTTDTPSATGAIKKVICTTTQSLGTSPASFLASAVFLANDTANTGPAVVDPAVSDDPSAKFVGAVKNAGAAAPGLELFAPCGP